MTFAEEREKRISALFEAAELVSKHHGHSALMQTLDGLACACCNGAPYTEEIACDWCGENMPPVCKGCVGKLLCESCNKLDESFDDHDPTDHDRLYDQWKDDGGRR